MKKSLIRISVAIVTLAVLVIAAFKLLLAGPLSQTRLVDKYSEENLRLIQAAELNIVSNWTMVGTAIEFYPWKPIPSFRPPDWTRNRVLAEHFNNGVIEAMPVNTIVGVKISNLVLVCTRAWFGHRRWGVAYSPTGDMIPLP